MSGTKEYSSDDGKITRTLNHEDVLFTLGEFQVISATFFTEETQRMESGYAAVWKQDNVMQMLSNNIAATLNFAGQANQTLQMARAAIEQEASAADTEGLVDDGGDFDEDGVLN